MASFLLGYLNLPQIFTIFNSNGEALFYIAMATIVLSVLPTLFFPEPPLIIKDENRNTFISENLQDDSQNEHSINQHENTRLVSGKIETKVKHNLFVDIWHSLVSMDPTIKWILVLYFFMNLCTTPFQFYYTDYMGTDIYGGDASAAEGSKLLKRYNMGVRYGSLGLMISLAVTSIISFFLNSQNPTFLLTTPITKRKKPSLPNPGQYLLVHPSPKAPTPSRGPNQSPNRI